MIALALLASLMVQDTNTALSPRVRAMIDRFPPPRPGLPSIEIRFSRDTVWIGEQVELVTATWFPRPLRDQLRRLPVISSPSLTGLWSARNQQLPIAAGSRMVGNQLYDLYVSWQTIYPLGGGAVEAPPATLTYNLPTSTAYFAPEERKTFHSTTATLFVRGVPAAMGRSLGTGPTAHNLRLTWRGPATILRAGSPAIVELGITGDGNITLWPAPDIPWPSGVHVYPEPTLEHPVPAQGLITGEKRFRFTIVADSAGVLTLPEVAYPYFDAPSVQVVPASASALTLAILARNVVAGERRQLTVTGSSDVPLATRVVRGWWLALVALAMVPVVLLLRPRRRRTARLGVRAAVDPEAALRRALGTPVDAGLDRVVAALRQRGVARDEAEQLHRWLGSVVRRRYGPNKAELPDPPPVLSRILARLRQGVGITIVLLLALPLRAQQDGGVTRFDGSDFPGAARAFEADVRLEPAAAGAWRDLGAARWMQHDDVGAAAAWLRALALAPRDPLLRRGWSSAVTIPREVRARAPSVPLSRDEFVLFALALWLLGWAAAARRWRRSAWALATLCAFSAGLAIVRWQVERPGQVLIVTNTPLRVSPHPAMPAVGELAIWTVARVGRRHDNWVLVDGQVVASGSPGALSVRGWIPVSVVAPIGPLD